MGKFLLAPLLLLLVACGGGVPGTAGFDLIVADRVLVGGGTTFVADQGDQITFTITADEQGELHLHGYDLRRDIGPDAPTTFTFTADVTGRFAMELHIDGAEDGHDTAAADHGHADHGHEDTGASISLGALEVRPR